MSTVTLLSIIALAESQLGIPSGLLQAICKVESDLNPYVVVERDGKGGRSSYGLCQIQQRTAAQFYAGVSSKKLLNPVVNAQLSGQYLTYQYKRYGSWDRAIVSYNRGSSTGLKNKYHAKVMKEWRINGGYKKYQKRTHSKGAGRVALTPRGVGFLHEDLTHAN